MPTKKAKPKIVGGKDHKPLIDLGIEQSDGPIDKEKADRYKQSLLVDILKVLIEIRDQGVIVAADVKDLKEQRR
jgi:hypothetical protein